MSEQITIVTDTRESLPLDFTKFRGADVVHKGLKTGDYSVLGFENTICFERKATPDAVGSMIGSHERFLREIDRMKDFKEKYILIEQSAGAVYRYCAKLGWEWKFDIVMQSLVAYAYHYQVRVRFCKDRDDMAQYIVKKSREFVAKERSEQCKNKPELSESQTSDIPTTQTSK